MSRSKPSAFRHSLYAALLLMCPFDLLASMGMDVYLPVVPEMPRILGTSPSVVQLSLSLYMLVLGAGQLLFGPIADAVGRRPVLLGGAVTFAIASFLLAAVTSAPPFLVFRVLQATGAAAALVATFATVRDVYAERPEGAVIYALFGSILAFVPALGPLLGAVLAKQFGWRSIFLSLGALAIAAAAHALPKWHETRPQRAGSSRLAVRAILSHWPFWTYTLGFSAAMGAFFVFFSTAPRVLMDQAGYSQFGFSLVFGTVAVVMMVTARFAGRFVARWGRAGSLRRGMGLLLAGGGLLGAGQTLATPSVWTFVLPMWVIAAGITFTCSVAANGALDAFGHAAGTATAIFYFVESVVVGVSGTAAVILLDGNTAWPLAVYCTVMALVTLVFLGKVHRIAST